ncbi:MAG: hypothetical protein ACFFB0_01470 [Promethearchaeota archaeon]
MEDFLRKIQLSNYAIEMYIKSLGKNPLTYYELKTIVSSATLEEFEESLNQLVNGGLLLRLVSEQHEVLTHYLAIPPILPILNYYENIESSLSNIKDLIQELMINSVNQIFQQDNTINLDGIVNTFHEFRKDIEEDTIIQKQEIEDIVEGMEALTKAKEEMIDLHENIKSITQTQFSNLLKTITTIKTEIITKLDELGFKKHRKEVISVLNQLFKEQMDKIIGKFTNNLHGLIEKEFNDFIMPLDKLIETTFEYRNDFKMILLNMLTNFESKMNKIYEMISENKDDLSASLKNLEIKIAENLNAVIQDSVNQIYNLNKPIEDVMKIYFHDIISKDKPVINNLWVINSRIKINEEIQKFITNSKKNLIIIVPNLENHLVVEQFENISKELKIRIASSEPHTNSLVKKFKGITNLTYKVNQNENLIALKGDNDKIAIGIIQNNIENPLNDFVGIGSNYRPFVKLLDSIVKSNWEEAYSDTFYASQKAKISGNITPAKPAMGTVKPISRSTSEIKKEPQKVSRTPTQVFERIEEIRFPQSGIIANTLKKKSEVTPKPAEQITDLTQKLQEKINSTAPKVPKAGDEVGLLINDAFNNLIQKLNNVKGEDFSKELQKIADFVLEKRGFSVTLHKLRSFINKYKEDYNLLAENDKNEIIDAIESWKKKLV